MHLNYERKISSDASSSSYLPVSTPMTTKFTKLTNIMCSDAWPNRENSCDPTSSLNTSLTAPTLLFQLKPLSKRRKESCSKSVAQETVYSSACSHYVDHPWRRQILMEAITGSHPSWCKKPLRKVVVTSSLRLWPKESGHLYDFFARVILRCDIDFIIFKLTLLIILMEFAKRVRIKEGKLWP